MSDFHTPDQRSRNMAAIRAKDTKPEMIVRKYLWKHGFRYRLNHPRLPGKPDIVLRQYRTCIFVNGCFWHGHNLLYDNDTLRYDDDDFISLISSTCCKIPKTNREFWQNKINRNQERDTEVKKKLASMGWHTITIWECELKPAFKGQTLASLAFTLNHIFLEHHKVKRYEIPEETDYAMVAEGEEIDDK